MLIGIVSDTHDRLDSAECALQMLHARGVRHVVHCGDWTTPTSMRHIIEHAAGLGMTMSGVLGNNDRQTGEFFRLLSHLPHGQHVVEGVFELRIAGKTIAAYHGHHKPTLMRVLGNFEYDAVFTGHSHKPRDERLENGVHVINPGSTAFAVPRRKDWQPSFAIYDTSTGCAEIVFY